MMNGISVYRSPYWNQNNFELRRSDIEWLLERNSLSESKKVSCCCGNCCGLRILNGFFFGNLEKENCGTALEEMRKVYFTNQNLPDRENGLSSWSALFTCDCPSKEVHKLRFNAECCKKWKLKMQSEVDLQWLEDPSASFSSQGLNFLEYAIVRTEEHALQLADGTTSTYWGGKKTKRPHAGIPLAEICDFWKAHSRIVFDTLTKLWGLERRDVASVVAGYLRGHSLGRTESVEDIAQFYVRFMKPKPKEIATDQLAMTLLKFAIYAKNAKLMQTVIDKFEIKKFSRCNHKGRWRHPHFMAIDMMNEDCENEEASMANTEMLQTLLKVPDIEAEKCCFEPWHRDEIGYKHGLDRCLFFPTEIKPDAADVSYSPLLEFNCYFDYSYEEQTTSDPTVLPWIFLDYYRQYCYSDHSWYGPESDSENWKYYEREKIRKYIEKCWSLETEERFPNWNVDTHAGYIADSVYLQNRYESQIVDKKKKNGQRGGRKRKAQIGIKKENLAMQGSRKFTKKSKKLEKARRRKLNKSAAMKAIKKL